MSKHTKGPWSFDGEFIRDKVGTCVLDVADANMNEDDARLIASAPELLEALERIAASDPTHTHFATLAISEARAAIAKATGEQA